MFVLGNVACQIIFMKYRTFRELMSEKLIQANDSKIISIVFQKWTGWKTPIKPLLIQSFLAIERRENDVWPLSIVRVYADDESDIAWRDFLAFDYAGEITSLSELVVEMKNHPGVYDPDYPLDVTEYDTLMENLTEMVATDALRHSYPA